MELRALKTFYSLREGLVTLEDDVLSVVRQVRELYGDRIKICLEPTTGQYVFSENCGDGSERLIFTTPSLDARSLQRLLTADSQLRGYEDPYDKAEREQDEAFMEKDKTALDGIRDAGERLAWAMEEDGKGTHAQAHITKDLSASS
jgi:hypothetical protein